MYGEAVTGLVYHEPQVCLGPNFAGAYYQFLVTGTTTPLAVYQTNNPLGNPYPITGYVQADNYGRFPPIYLDVNLLNVYRVQLYNGQNQLVYDLDPYAQSINNSGVESAAAYGYTIAPTGEVTVAAPNVGGAGSTLTLNAGSVGSVPLEVSAPLAGASAIIVNSSATTGAQNATFVAANKPGTAASSPAGWLPITCDGVQYYTPVWHGNNFTPYVANPTALGESISGTTVTFAGNGLTTVTGGTAVPGSWYAPNQTGIGAGYDIKITKTSGLSGVLFSIGGAQTNITAGGLTISNNAAAAVTGTYQIITHGGSAVVASGTITLSGGSGIQSPTYNGAANLVLAGNGTATLNGASTSNWYAPTTANVGSGYWIKITQTGGTSGYTFSAAAGSWTNITNSGLTIGISGTGQTSFNVTGTYIIASDAGGVTQLGSGSVTLSGTSGGGFTVQSSNWSGTTPLVLAGNGTATLNGVSTASWGSPTTANQGAGYWIKITKTGGTSGVNFTAAQGSWTNITNSGLTVNISGYTGDVGTATASGTYQISSSSSGTPVLGSGNVSLSVSGLTVLHVYTTVTTNATETIPTGTTNVRCEVWGSGGGGGGRTGSGDNVNAGYPGGCGGFAYSVYTAAVLGGTGKTFKYTVTAGGAGGAVGVAGTAGTAGSITAGTVTGFSAMTGNGGGGGGNGNGPAGGAGGTGTGGNTNNITGASNSTTGTTGKISGDGGPYGKGGTAGLGAGGNGTAGAAVFYYT